MTYSEIHEMKCAKVEMPLTCCIRCKRPEFKQRLLRFVYDREEYQLCHDCNRFYKLIDLINPQEFITNLMVGNEHLTWQQCVSCAPAK